MTPKIGTCLTAATASMVFVLGLTPPAHAQGTQSAPLGTPEFAKQIDGKRVTITLTDGRNYDGLFVIEGQTLVSRGQPATVTLPANQIVRVEKNPRRIRLHSLIGLTIGAGLGAVALAACYEDCVAVGFAAIGIYGGLGAAIGTGVGAILNSVNREHDVIYDSNRRTVAWSVAPMVSPTRRGATFTVRWR
jgi:hypothetical protein